MENIYSRDQVIQDLTKKGCLFFDVDKINIHNAKDLGNTSWGKINFLVREFQYSWIDDGGNCDY